MHFLSLLGKKINFEYKLINLYPFLSMDSDLLVSFNCFLIRKMSHHGSLGLHTKYISFEFSSGEEQQLKINLVDIKSVNVEKRLIGAVSNLEFHTEDQVYLFSGIHEADTIKNYVTLLQSQITTPTPTYGFVDERPKSEEIKWTPLANPSMLVNATFQASFQTMTEFLESDTVYQELYARAGNEDIKIGPWEMNNGYKERAIDYMKAVVVPVLGKNMIHVVEYQRFFEIEGGLGIHVISDLGKTPYADCFDPFVQITLIDKGDNNCELTVNLEIVWSSEPFVKSIVESQTKDAIKALYTDFVKDIKKELGDEDGASEKDSDAEVVVDSFSKIKIIYKISIIALIILLICTWLWRYWPEGGVHYDMKAAFSIFSLVLFSLMLVFA